MLVGLPTLTKIENVFRFFNNTLLGYCGTNYERK